jgi:hypothetical protein
MTRMTRMDRVVFEEKTCPRDRYAIGQTRNHRAESWRLQALHRIGARRPRTPRGAGLLKSALCFKHFWKQSDSIVFTGQYLALLTNSIRRSNHTTPSGLMS